MSEILTQKQKDIILHTLGLDRGKKHYRNHFVTTDKSDDHCELEALVNLGFMTKRKDPFNDFAFVYHCTDKTIELFESVMK